VFFYDYEGPFTLRSASSKPHFMTIRKEIE
jgi:hypothetical protein